MRHGFVLAALMALVSAPVAARAEGTSFSGKAFVDYSYKDNSDEGKHVSDHGPGLDFKRFYFTIDNKFDDTWAARLRFDITDQNTYKDANGNTVPTGKLDVFVKNAYVEAKLAPELLVRAGAADMPWIAFVEDLYGFRYVEQTLMDRLKFANSADWGLHAGGKLADGLVNYQVSVVNGRGYADLTRSQSPTFEARLGVAPLKQLNIAVGGEYGTLGQDTKGVYTPNTAKRVSAVVGWVDGGLRLGAEGFYAKDRSAAIVKGGQENTALGAGGWASYEFIPSFTAFGRVDYTKPANDHSDIEDFYFDLGLEHKPVKAVSLALVYKRDVVSNTGAVGTIATGNGTIGGSNGANGIYNEIGVFGQYVF